MRTGVLADSNNSFFQPMDHVSHERHLGLPHIAKHTRTTRKRKQGYRSTPRPRAPYMAHYELAQLMNPENPRESLEAFSTHMEASQRPDPFMSSRRAAPGERFIRRRVSCGPKRPSIAKCCRLYLSDRYRPLGVPLL